jgi:tight adherence protein C
MALSRRITANQLEELPESNLPSLLVLWVGKVSKMLQRKPKNQSLELPEFLRVFALLLSNGMPIGVAISWLAPKLSGRLGDGLSTISANLELGADLVSELRKLDREFANPAMTEFCQKLISSLERGSQVSGQITQLARSLSQELGRNLTKRAGSNETKMLIPTIFLILPVTVLFAVFPSVLVLQSQL